MSNRQSSGLNAILEKADKMEANASVSIADGDEEDIIVVDPVGVPKMLETSQRTLETSIDTKNPAS